MESVNYEYFDSENDYSKNPNATKHRSFNVSRGDFSKYAILNGFYGKKLISRDARKFYSSMCRMAVKKEKGFYVISDEYEFAETSYKNEISFAMGMLATRIIANEIYNINKLYHFTDKSFKGTLVNGKMAPDWIGVDGQKKVFLFESKGTCNKNVRKKTIEHAKVQLNNVGSIKDTSTNQMYYPQKDSKHVICSCFDAYSGIDKVWNIHDVDPEGKGEVNLEINFDKECFMYYQAFVSYVDSLNQVYLNGPGLLYNYDLTAYAPQIMQNMADAQHSNGAMPTTAPEYVIFEGPGMDVFAESPEWGGSLVIFPFMYYETYGDDSLIKKYYPNMRRYVDYLKTRADKGILSFGLGDWYDYGDFRAGFSRNTPVPLVATAHYYMTVMYLVQAAKMVGNDFDIHYYTSLAQDIMVAFNKCFLHKDTAQYGTGSQCSNALPLFLQMTQDADKQGNYRPDADLNEKVFANLIKDVEAHGNRLTTGDVGNRYLIQTLARNGEHELIYKMFNHEEAPGYGFQLKFGATTLTEQWDPRQGSSWNHFMMGQIDEWFFNSLVGIRPSTTPKQGYQKFIIAPQPVGDLKYVKASYETLYGTINVDWTCENGTFTLNVSVPVNTTAVVYLPGEKEPKEIQSGTYQLVCAK